MTKKTQKQLKRGFSIGLRCIAYEAMRNKDLRLCNQMSILLKEFNEFVHVSDEETIKENLELANELFEFNDELHYYDDVKAL